MSYYERHYVPVDQTIPFMGKRMSDSYGGRPLPSLIKDVKFIDSFANEDGTAVTAEFHCELLNPSCTLRVIDRFVVNEEGRIVEQENFFDPRDLTQPGWR